MTPRLAASSSAIFDASLPPASAKSGRPPPPPPTIGASCLTTWPAGTFFVRSGVTPTTIETLPSDGRGEDDDAALDLIAMLVDERAQAVLVEAADLPCNQLHAGDVDRRRRPRRARRRAQRGLHPCLLELASQPLVLVLQRRDARDELARASVERAGQAARARRGRAGRSSASRGR